MKGPSWTQRARDAERIYRDAEPLYSLAELDAALRGMAAALNQRFSGGPPPVLLCAMVGAAVMTGRLLPMLEFPFELGYLHLTRYGHTTVGGHLKQVAPPSVDLAGRVTVLLDDILDEGDTLAAMRAACDAAGAASVYCAVLVDKQRSGRAACADLAMVRVPDRYVFGFGLDYKGYLRNAPGLFAVRSARPTSD